MKLENFANMFLKDMKDFSEKMEGEDFDVLYRILKKYSTSEISYMDRYKVGKKKTLLQKYIKEAIYVKHLEDMNKIHIAHKRKQILLERIKNSKYEKEVLTFFNKK